MNHEEEIGGKQSRYYRHKLDWLAVVLLVMDVVFRKMMVGVRSVDVCVAIHLREDVDCCYIQERTG